VSSKADDFDVRHRDDRDDRAWGDGGYAGSDPGNDHGAAGGTVDYDLGYDANGWDTQGFRSPVAGYADQHETTRLGRGVRTAPQRGKGRGGSHARTASTQQAGAPDWDALGNTGAWSPDQSFQSDQPYQPYQPEQPEQPGRRGRRAKQGGPGGPRGPRGQRVKVKGSWWRHWTWRKALGVVLGVIGGFIILAAIAIAVAYEETPVPSDAMAATGFAQSVVYSSNGTLIGRFGSTDRVELTYNQIPQPLIYAVLAAEDRNFFNEGGVSPTGIIRAAFADLTGSDGSLQGGSTITQEFVRQYYTGIGTQQTMSRKIKEIFVAMKVAKEKSKQWILTNYLNTIYFGEGSYGVQAAAETYFGKPVSKLTVAQDAVIAAVLQQPSTYPLPQYRAQLEARWHYVLNGMVATGHLTAEQAATMKFPALGDPHVPQTVGTAVWDPYVLTMIRSELENVYGFSEAQIDNGGYVITTSLSDSKMRALYQAVSQTEAQIDQDSTLYPFKNYMHVGAMLIDPATGQIQAMYPGPGFPGSKENGTGPVLTARECAEKAMDCQWNMATQNREQVGSSFKPYILATAVKQMMNVKTSTLYGFTPAWIPPDTQPTAFPTQAKPATTVPDYFQYHEIDNDSPAENGAFNPQMAMAESINTAFTDLWHVVGGANVADMAQAFGVNTNAACITASCGTAKNPVPAMEHEVGVTLGQASLTVEEQASMLATLADNGVYHDPHLITKITQNNVPTPIKVTSRQVFSNNPTQNAEMDSQVQYAMSADTAAYGTAPVAAMSNGQPIIAKTGTTETAESAFFIGAVPSQALAVAMFTSEQDGNPHGQSLNLLGGQQQGGFGGTWPATIWHTYAENMFVPLGVQQWQPVVFTGSKWNEVPKNLQKPAKKKHKKQDRNQNPNPGNGSGYPTPPPNGGNPNPFPTYSCDPTVVTCNPNAPDGAVR
jgi:membrane peptidoglycan carboxypeptidase